MKATRSSSQASRLKRCAKYAALAIAACMLIGLPVAGAISGHTHYWSEWAGGLNAFVGKIASLGIVGLIAVVAVMVLIASTGFLPASMIGVASGSIYGLWVGFLVATFATLVGAWVSFAVSRSLLRGAFSRLFVRRARVQQFGTEVARRGWRFVCLLRMSPVMPFAITSYALGLSPIGTRDYTVGTAAALPALFGYVCMGWLARGAIGGGSASASRLQWAIVGVGVVATIGLTFYMKRMLGASARRSDGSE